MSCDPFVGTSSQPLYGRQPADRGQPKPQGEPAGYANPGCIATKKAAAIPKLELTQGFLRCNAQLRQDPGIGQANVAKLPEPVECL